jgi:hypothetical protein
MRPKGREQRGKDQAVERGDGRGVGEVIENGAGEAVARLKKLVTDLRLDKSILENVARLCSANKLSS